MAEGKGPLVKRKRDSFLGEMEIGEIENAEEWH